MNDIELEKFKEKLLTLKSELLQVSKDSEQDHKPVDLDQSSVGRLSRMDAMQSQAMAVENKRRREIQLTRIEAALERMEEGEYGYCPVCDEEINLRRLQVDPANPFCLNCASKI